MTMLRKVRKTAHQGCNLLLAGNLPGTYSEGTKPMWFCAFLR